MSNNLSKHTLGLTQLQSGQGTPTHQADLGSLYIDVLNADYYKNTDGVTNWVLITSGGGGGTFTGGTVTGPTIFTNGLTANTISAATYLNLPLDIRVTGGTYDNSTGIATFTNNTGGTFTVIGFYTGGTDYYVTGGTYSNGTLTLNRQNGSVTIPGLNFTGNTSGDCITDLYITNLHGCSPITVYDSIQSINSSATGTTSFAFGKDVNAHGDYSTASGRYSTASGYASHAEGYNTTASGDHSHAEGDGSVAIGNWSHAEGQGSTASGYYSHAEGSSTASGYSSHSEGNGTIAIGDYSHSEGESTITSGMSSHAEGINTTASGNYSHAEGESTIASGVSSHAEGYFTKSIGYSSHAEGKSSQTGILDAFSGTVVNGLVTLNPSYGDVSGQFTPSGLMYLYDEQFNNNYGSESFSISAVTFTTETQIQLNNITVNSATVYVGDITTLSAYNGFGGDQIVPGDFSHSEGNGSYSIASNSHAEGTSYALGLYSHSEGSLSITTGNYSHAEGGLSTASGNYSHAEGRSTSSGFYSHSEGFDTTASGNGSHSEGFSTTASGSYSHAEGFSTNSIGLYSHAEGEQSSATGNYSHAEGKSTLSSSSHSHAEGFQVITSGDYSHAEGSQTYTSGEASHAEGLQTSTNGDYSHSEGGETSANNKGDHSEGYQTYAGAFGYFVTATNGFITFSPAFGDITSYFLTDYVVLSDYLNTQFYGYYEISGYTFYGSQTELQLNDTSLNFTGYTLGFPIFKNLFKPTSSLGIYSHSEGLSGITYGPYSHVEGYNNNSIGLWSHAEGHNTISWGTGSHTQGISTNAFSDYSFASGSGSTASGQTTFIHSVDSLVTGNRSVVLGGQNITGSTDDTVYVPYLNIKNIGAGSPVFNLGLDSNGFVVTGTAGGGGTFTGGTITGPTTFTNGLTANTISAATYQNLPTDIRVTGGTYSNGTLTFTNNTGGTFNVTGLYTGQTSYVNSLTTGAGLSANTTTGNITIINTAPDQTVTLTNGTGISVTGTYPNFTITSTGSTGTDVYVTGFTYNNANTFTIADNSGSTYSATINTVTGLTSTGTITSSVLSAATYQNLPIDIRVTGGTYSNGTATFTNNTGGTFTVTGFVTGDTFVTGVTYSANTLTIGQNQGQSNLTTTVGLRTKSGSVASGTFAGTPRTAAVTFTTAFANTNYSIQITGADNRSFTYQSKATTGFTINTNANTPLTGNVDWVAIEHGES